MNENRPVETPGEVLGKYKARFRATKQRGKIKYPLVMSFGNIYLSPGTCDLNSYSKCLNLTVCTLSPIRDDMATLFSTFVISGDSEGIGKYQYLLYEGRWRQLE